MQKLIALSFLFLSISGFAKIRTETIKLDNELEINSLNPEILFPHSVISQNNSATPIIIDFDIDNSILIYRRRTVSHYTSERESIYENAFVIPTCNKNITTKQL